MRQRHGYVITPRMTYIDGVAVPTPADFASRGWGRLITDLAARTDVRQATIILDAEVARAFALPTSVEDFSEVMDHHVAAEDARAYGWSVRRIGAWSTYRADGRPLLRVGIWPLVKTDWTLSDTPADASADLAEWARRTGSAYHGNAGVAGIAVLSDAYPPRGKGLHPKWKPAPGVPPDAVEDDYRSDQWRAERAGTQWAHSYDVNRAYVGAAQVVRVCPYELRRTGRREWARDVAGWWLVQLPEWPHRHMPDPAGYGEEERTPTGHRLRWVTAPTMELLTWVAEQGWSQPPLVVDSWTGPAKEVLRPWAATMRQAWDACQPCQPLKEKFVDEEDLCPVCQTVKRAGRASLGMLDSPTSWIYRPDWWWSVVAMCRANIWRRAWKVGGGRPNGPGPWPLWIDVDNLWYGSDVEDPRVSCPDGLVIGTRLGEVKPKKSKRRRGK